jgi:F0F1-type ATP synthase membrane subunit c/vacuolar-type H+-ATPase subunit K
MDGTRQTFGLRRGRELFAGAAAVYIALAIITSSWGAMRPAITAGFTALACVEAAMRRPATASPRVTWLIVLGMYALTLAVLSAPRWLPHGAG